MILGSHMESMTGFASVQLKRGPWIIEVQLKSLNSRYLELRCQLPRYWESWELSCKQLLSQYFDRGTIELKVNLSPLQLKPQKPEIQKEILADYLRSWKHMSRSLKLKVSVPTHLELFYLLPGVVREDAKNDFPNLIHTQFLALMDKACRALQDSRRKEGKKLAQSWQGSWQKLKKIREDFSESYRKNYDLLRPPKAWRERIVKHLEQKNLPVDESRLLQEWAYWCERASVHEELERLSSHELEVDRLLTEAKRFIAVGKKLDFFLAEFHREWNTIGSKVQQAHLNHLVIEAKLEIDKLKEQVQNIQ